MFSSIFQKMLMFIDQRCLSIILIMNELLVRGSEVSIRAELKAEFLIQLPQKSMYLYKYLQKKLYFYISEYFYMVI